MTNDWYDIKFLESASNVRELIGKTTGRTPSATVAREISVCIQQGRLYFEAAVNAPLQIKPLQIYYGVVAFAQAVIVATRFNTLSTLKPSHGLSDVSPGSSGVEDLTLRVDENGTFQEFNNAIAPLGRIWYFDNSMPKWYEKPFDKADRLVGQKIGIKEIFARSPELIDKYNQTFGSPANAIRMSLAFGISLPDQSTLDIDDPHLFSDRNDMIELVKRLRTDYPFLEQWRFISAEHAWGKSRVVFDNAVKSDYDDLSSENLVSANNKGFVNGRTLGGVYPPTIPANDILTALSGGYINSSTTCAMQPINGVKLSEYALQYLGTFLLSSLVRYRPQIWQSAISRSFTADSVADDRALSLIEKFLDDTLGEFPKMIVRVIDYQRHW